MDQIIDTQSFIWYIEGNPSLSSSAVARIEDHRANNWVSAASLWEMAIKVSIGKLHLSEPYGVLIPREIANNGFELLPIKIEHSTFVATLPFYDKKHRDPFDRLIISQALVENWPVISCDVLFDAYPVERIW